MKITDRGQRPLGIVKAPAPKVAPYKVVAKWKSIYLGIKDFVVWFSDIPNEERRIAFNLEGKFFKAPYWAEDEPVRFEYALHAVKEAIRQDRDEQMKYFRDKRIAIPESLLESLDDYEVVPFGQDRAPASVKEKPKIETHTLTLIQYENAKRDQYLARGCTTKVKYDKAYPRGRRQNQYEGDIQKYVAAGGKLTKEQADRIARSIGDDFISKRIGHDYPASLPEGYIPPAARKDIANRTPYWKKVKNPVVYRRSKNANNS